jgi:hypothetical protein
MTRHRSRRRSGPRRAGRRPALILVLLTVTACSQGGERQPAQEPRTQALASTSTSVPATTVIAGQQVSLKEVESIEGAVRKYFDAFFSADFKGLATHSTGELKVLAGWQRILNGESTGLGALKPAAATVEDLKVVSVTGDAATVEIKGQLDETASVIEGNRGEDRLLSTSIDGAVKLVRGTTWQVADFHRGGRWARGQIYTKVRDQQSGQGVVVKVVGVDLRPKGTVVMMELRNTTGLEAGAGGTVVRDASGRRLQIALGRDLVVVQVKGRSKATTGLFYMSALRPTTRSFNYLVDVNLGCNPVCTVGTSMDIPVWLLG